MLGRGWVAFGVAVAFLSGGGGTGAYGQDDKSEREKRKEQDRADKDKKKELDKEAKNRIKEFKTEVKKAETESDVVMALETLGGMQHEKILAEIAAYLGFPDPSVRKEAARQIGMYKGDASAASVLLQAAKREKENDVRARIVEYVGNVGLKESAGMVAGFFRDRSTDVQLSAVLASVAIRARESIEPLIRLLEELEAIDDQPYGIGGQPAPGTPQLPGGQYLPRDDESIKRKRQMTPQVQTALKDLTGERYLKAEEWTKWWSKHKAKFEVPE